MTRVTIWKEFTFEAAHRLDRLPPTHKCSRLHGHNYRVRVTLKGQLDEKLGWVIDFGELESQISEILTHLDHQNLNDVLDRPTTVENVAIWIWDMIYMIQLAAVEVWENDTSGAKYEGPSAG